MGPRQILFSAIIPIGLAKYTPTTAFLGWHIPASFCFPPRKILFCKGFRSDALDKNTTWASGHLPVPWAPLGGLRRVVITPSAQTIREAFIEHQMFATSGGYPESPQGYRRLSVGEKTNSQGGVERTEGKTQDCHNQEGLSGKFQNHLL